MAQNASADDDAQTTTDAVLELDALEPGRVVEVTYDGSRGSRTVRGYVAHVETTDALLDRYAQDYEVRIGTPDDHTPRFLRLSFDTTDAEEESGSYSFEENYDNVRSMNSKSSRGQRLGTVEAFEVTDETDRRGVEVAEFRALSEGDRVQVEDRTATVLSTDGRPRVEFDDDGSRESLSTTATRGVYYSVIDADDDYSKTVHAGEFEVLNETVEPSEEEGDLWDRVSDYGHSFAAGEVETVLIAGDAYEVVYRPTDSSPTVDLRSPEFDEEENRRNYDASLVLEPTGLRLSPAHGGDVEPRTLDAADVELVHADDAQDEDDDEDDNDRELVTDGGQETNGVLDLPDYGNVADYADDVDLSEFSDDDLDDLDDRLSDMLNGDPYAFPSDEALQAAFDLSARLRDEQANRDPRRDDPHFTPHDSDDRYEVEITSVEVEQNGPTTFVRLRLDDDYEGDGTASSTWTTRPGLDIARLVRDYLDLDDLRAIGTCVGQSLPVVGSVDGGTWARLDRYALENDGTTALDDDPELVTDGGRPVEDEDDEEEVYAVPVEGFGSCHVVASDPDDAVEQAERYASTDDLNRQIDANAAEQTHAVEEFRGTPANRSSPSSDRVDVPRFPSVQELRAAREDLNLDMPEVARYLDVTASGLGKWEREESAISLEQARRYARVLGRLQRDEQAVLERTTKDAEEEV